MVMCQYDEVCGEFDVAANAGMEVRPGLQHRFTLHGK